MSAQAHVFEDVRGILRLVLVIALQEHIWLLSLCERSQAVRCSGTDLE